MAKVGIIVGSNSRSKLTFAAMMSVIQSSIGNETVVFLTMDAVKAFTKNPEVREDDQVSKLIREKGEQDYLALFKKAKANTKIYACSMASKLFGLKKEDYNELVDDVVGIMSFYNEVEGGQIIDVW